MPGTVRSFLYFVLVRLVGVLTRPGSVSQLQLENAVLRHQVKVLRLAVRRPELRDRDRAFLAAAIRALSRDRWASFMVTPQTLLRWHASSSGGNGPTVGEPQVDRLSIAKPLI